MDQIQNMGHKTQQTEANEARNMGKWHIMGENAGAVKTARCNAGVQCTNGNWGKTLATKGAEPNTK